MSKPETRVVDTNVLLVASAADAGSPFDPEATPVDDKELEVVLNWLIQFEKNSSCHIVLDNQWQILGEYEKKLDTHQDYGYRAITAKIEMRLPIRLNLNMFVPSSMER
ncbi:MAG: hypothetical protein H7829_01925 [Magnetococcus sp. THC-1_WYH]